MGLTILNSVEAAQAFGESWAANLVGGEIFALSGVLGAGKTQLVKGLARGLGFRGDVTSPTFTIVHEYRGGRLPIYHIDLYRIDTERELDTLGLEDLLAPNCILLIEWGDKFPGLQRDRNLEIVLERVGETERRIQVSTG